MANPITSWLLGKASRLRFPTLFAVTLAIFLIDLVVPDVIPFVDEILLGLGTLVLGSLRRKTRELPEGGQAEPPSTKD